MIVASLNQARGCPGGINVSAMFCALQVEQRSFGARAADNESAARLKCVGS